VQLSGSRFASDTPGTLQLEARAGGKMLVKESVKLSHFLGQGSKIVVPFLVRNTGCERLTLTATLRNIPKGQVGRHSLTKTVPFRCGE
jgi:hypothetical protein